MFVFVLGLFCLVAVGFFMFVCCCFVVFVCVFCWDFYLKPGTPFQFCLHVFNICLTGYITK